MKYNSDSFIVKYKTRLVVYEFSQLHRIDFKKIFAITMRRESLRIFLAIAIIIGMVFLQMNVISEYLESAFG